MPEPVKPEIRPPKLAISAAANVDEVSLSVKVMVAVSPIFRAALLDAMVTVGATVSIESEGVSTPATLLLPAGSVNVLAATEMEPAVVELAAGVNVAV